MRAKVSSKNSSWKEDWRIVFNVVTQIDKLCKAYIPHKQIDINAILQVYIVNAFCLIYPIIKRNIFAEYLGVWRRVAVNFPLQCTCFTLKRMKFRVLSHCSIEFKRLHRVRMIVICLKPNYRDNQWTFFTFCIVHTFFRETRGQT